MIDRQRLYVRELSVHGAMREKKDEMDSGRPRIWGILFTGWLAAVSE